MNNFILYLIMFIFLTITFVFIKVTSKALYFPKAYKNLLLNNNKYYIEPDCQSVDPSDEDSIVARVPLYKVMDKVLNQATHRYLFLLADSGMGKTSFCVNYYSRHFRKMKRNFDIVLLSFGTPDIDERIREITNKKGTVIFLDGFDEDERAVVDFKSRIIEIVNMTSEFYKVVITCRTQFFPSDREIPLETGLMRTGPRSLGVSASIEFHKLFIAPFDNKKIDEYLKTRYKWWNIKKYTRAKKLVEALPSIAKRPMLIELLSEIANISKDHLYSYEIYEEILNNWLKREEGLFSIKFDEMYQFCENMAYEIYINRIENGSEKITLREIIRLAEDWNISLSDWQITRRSLLNRDSEGNYKFAHRSILEYLVIKKLIKSGGAPNSYFVLTDLMKNFLLEMIKSCKLKIINLENIDLSNLNFAGMDFKYARLIKANLQNSNFQEANLEKADLRFANLRAANLSKANLQEVNLSEANLEKADLRFANLRAASLNKANLQEANLSDAKLEEADLHYANLKGTILINTSLEKANFDNAIGLTTEQKENSKDYLLQSEKD